LLYGEKEPAPPELGHDGAGQVRVLSEADESDVASSSTTISGASCDRSMADMLGQRCARVADHPHAAGSRWRRTTRRAIPPSSSTVDSITTTSVLAISGCSRYAVYRGCKDLSAQCIYVPLAWYGFHGSNNGTLPSVTPVMPGSSPSELPLQQGSKEKVNDTGLVCPAYVCGMR
jgi:hypothetical protein